mmetsp:Transcript_17626/g.26076  ORF Transcript_17626/g.26076 Transcript_17626/m.26076 type:complete len:98 (-) Transcript_17626:568-861(-)
MHYLFEKGNEFVLEESSLSQPINHHSSAVSATSLGATFQAAAVSCNGNNAIVANKGGGDIEAQIMQDSGNDKEKPITRKETARILRRRSCIFKPGWS